MRRRGTLQRLSSGALAGLAGSVAMQGLQAAGQRFMPRQMPPIRRHPGQFMVEKAEELIPPQAQEKIPEAAEKATAQTLGVGYGVMFALLYSAARPRVKNLFFDGTMLGLATWAAGYLGWLPATHLMPAITRQKPLQVFGAMGSHILFGLATVAAYQAVRKRL